MNSSGDRKHELSIESSKRLSTKVSTGDIGEILKPLIKEIHLFDSFVAGTMQLKDKEILDHLHVGQTLLLERKASKFDENEVAVFTEDKVKIGYIPERDNLIFARLMDAGKLLRGKINSIEKKHDFSKIAIGIYLIDI